MKILVTGASGLLAREVIRKLRATQHEIAGIDARPWPDAPAGVNVHVVDVRKRAAEDVFRRFRPNAVIHMATVTHLREKSAERYRINLGGTSAVFDHAEAHGAKHVIFVGRHTFYGAAPDSPLYHKEYEPPIGAHAFPELADLVAADLYACTALWRIPELKTCVLRVCYTLGPSRHGTLSAYLHPRRVPTVMGFDPLFQFMHEDDVAGAIVAALEKRLHGVYNVAGPPPLHLATLIRAVGHTPLRIPEPLLRFAFGRFGLPLLPPGAVTHLKYPVVIDATTFKLATGFQFRYDERQTIDSFRAAPDGK
ncbi:MAG TPA: SDR family oxidoreductase [Polyangiaceae bacterium]